MTKKKYCYEFTEYRQYKCSECGRTMHKPTPHFCNGQYRKHKLNFFEDRLSTCKWKEIIIVILDFINSGRQRTEILQMS